MSIRDVEVRVLSLAVFSSVDLEKESNEAQQSRGGCLRISDKADEGAVLDKQMFYIMAAKNSAMLVAELVGLLGVELSGE